MEACIIPIKQIQEPDGKLCVVESIKHLPFIIKRIFYISDVPFGSVRGNHASITSDFFYVCLCGTVKIDIDTGEIIQTFILSSDDKGLFLPRKTWMRIYDFTSDALLLVLASEPYSAEEYYEDYNTFKRGKANE